MVVWSPFRFNSGREMANRFAIAPLTTDSSHEDGTATQNELEFVRRRAASGFGATISSAAYVEQDGRSWQGIGATHDGHSFKVSPAHQSRSCSPCGLLRGLRVVGGSNRSHPEVRQHGQIAKRLPDAIALYRHCEPSGRNHDADRIRVWLYTRKQKQDFPMPQQDERTLFDDLPE
jgi:hypothetical protein